VLELGPSKHVCLFMIEVTSKQTLRNWYHFNNPNRHLKSLLSVKQLLNAVSSVVVLILLDGLETIILKNVVIG
jgi:hypothetical protein